ncbi:MAG TPA: PAS domain S-box protein [Waterburya sp.]|jgi:PAS domain S-box-containing protein
MLKLSRSLLRSYGIAILSVASALLLTWLLQSVLAPTVFLLFYPAVMVSALYGGVQPGVVASILSALVCKYFFLTPIYSLTIPDLSTGVRLFVLLVVLLLAGTTTAALRTSRRQTELSLLKLQASEERYRVLAENVPQLVWITRADGFVEYVNQRWLDYTGLKSDETLGWDWHRAIHPDELSATLEQWKTGLATGNSVEVHYRLKRKDELYRWHIMRAMPLHNAKGEIVNWFGTCTDIHDQKQAEEALYRREQEFRTLAENSPDIIARIDKDLRHVYVNPAIEQATGMLPEALIGKTYLELGFPEAICNPWQQIHQNIFATGKPNFVEFDFPAPDGVRSYQSRLVPEFGGEGSVESILAITHDVTDYKRVEQALRQSEARFRRVVESNMIGIGAWNRNGQITEANEALLQLVGYTQADVEAGNLYWEELTPPEYRHLDEKALREIESSGICTPFEKEYIHKDGQRIPILIGAAAFQDIPDSGVFFVLNLMESKQVEKALRDALQKLNFHVENTPLAVIERDRHFSITRWSQGAQRIFGWQAEEVIGRGPEEWQTIYPEDIEVVNNAKIRLLNGDEQQNICRNRSYKKDGSIIYSEWYNSALLNESGNLVSVLSLVLDVTERKQAEEALRWSEERFRQLAENIQDVFWMLDFSTQQLLYVSPAYAQIWGRSCESLYANPHDWLEAIHPQDREWVRTIFYEQVLEGGFDAEYRIVHPDGSIRWVRDRGFPVKDESGDTYRIAGIAEDITERKQAEEERIHLLKREREARAQAEAANRIKDEFLAVLSHELRSPLNPILGWSKLLQDRQFDEKSMARGLEIIERNAKLQIQLIEDLLDVSRILRGKLSLTVCSVNLVSTIEAAIETVRLAASAKSIQIQTVYEPDIVQVLGDSARLQQVLWNLLSNAVKFTPNGGRVKVRLSVENELNAGFWEDNLQPSTSYAQIQVIDTGKGINPDFLPYVFDYFRQQDSTTTRSFGGLGLGLAIVHHLIELHGGTVYADSPGEGQGATFTVQLPLMTTRITTQVDQPSDDNSPDLKGIRVVVVDDEVDMREFLAFMLKDYGAQVTVVASAKEALEVLPQVMPDILLSDIGMPEVDGYMLMRQIRAMPPAQGGQIPAIALTAYAGEVDQTQALAAGFHKHVAKPIEPEKLAALVASLARNPGNR